MTKITLLLVALLVSQLASAETPALAGKDELVLQGWLDYQGPNGDNIDLLAGYGWFVDANLRLGGEFQWSLIEDIAPGEQDYRSQQVLLSADWLFSGGNLVPYVGLLGGYRNSKYEDLDEAGMVYGGRIGLRYFLNDSVSVNAAIGMLFGDKEVFIVDFEADDRYVYPSIGLSAVF